MSVNINKYKYLSAATLIQLDIHKPGEHREPGALGPHDEGCFSEWTPSMNILKPLVYQIRVYIFSKFNENSIYGFLTQQEIIVKI